MKSTITADNMSTQKSSTAHHMTLYKTANYILKVVNVH